MKVSVEEIMTQNLKTALELLRNGGCGYEVNMRAQCHIKKWDYEKWKHCHSGKRYTTSIDAQADLLPEGWDWWLASLNGRWKAELSYRGQTKVHSDLYLDEPRARLDVILQVLIWEIENE